MRKICVSALFACFFGVSVVAPVQALTVLQLNLEQLTALSERVFVGKCLSVKETKDKSGRPVDRVTFEIGEMLKGEPAKRVTFRQLRGAALGLDLPHYEPGEEAVVFLSEEGRLGLTAPVGLHQGKFEIGPSSEGTGEKTVINGAGNRGLFLGWKKSPRYKSIGLKEGEKQLLKSGSGPLPLGDFVSLVKKISTP